MKPSYCHLSILVLSILLTAGCKTSGIANRINEKPTVFAALAPDQKTYVMDGVVFPGDSADVAYIALGPPTSVETKHEDDTTVEMWTYKKYYPSGELADFLTKYSLAKNPNLLRSLNLEIGQPRISVNGPTVPGAPKPSLFATSTSKGNELSLPDVPIYNLYVFFYKKKVVDIKIESIDATNFAWLSEAIELEKANKLKEARL